MTLERVAREATGRLVAALARASGDLALAEDAFAGALLAALEQWPEAGIPEDPEGWLYTVAKRKLVGHWRKGEVRRRKAEALRQLHEIERGGAGTGPDDRVPLLFVCAHPAIAAPLRAPLMLQAVLGLTAEDIGPLMGVAPKTMGQRLWRAKAKIRDAKIPFSIPEGEDLEPRVGAVLDAVYALYGVGLHSARGRLTDEARWLADVVAELLDEPEAWGLAALLHYAGARRPAGREGVYVPLDEQDPRDWDRGAVATADACLTRARAASRIGPFQLEAAIQSALVHGRLRGAVDHDAVVTLYAGLAALAPTLGVRVGEAAARAERDGPATGLAALDAIDGEGFQPWWAVRADLLRRLRRPDADAAYRRAIDLCDDPAVVTFLERRRQALEG